MKFQFYKKKCQLSKSFVTTLVQSNKVLLINEAEEVLQTVGPFVPRPPIGNLPKVHRINPTKVQLQHHPRYRYPAQSLMRAIDIENRFRYDTDKRTQLFFSIDTAPEKVNEESQTDNDLVVKPGCILLVDMISSRVNPQRRSFSGVVLGVTKRGIMSSVSILSQVMGVQVEMSVPIYSPMVQRFVVVRGAPASTKDLKTAYWIRDKPCEGVVLEEVEGIVSKFRNVEARNK
jgi:ribosomal protein L19